MAPPRGLNPPTDLVCIQGMRLLHLHALRTTARLATAGCLVFGATLVSAPTLPAQSAPLAPGAVRWPVRTLPHVDLWLHALALVSDDSSKVPLFRRHYRDSLTVEKNRRNIASALDVNRVTLQRGIARAGGYLDAHFLPFAFNDWEEMRSTAERFLQVGGDPRRLATRDEQMRAAPFAAVFASAADREWLRLFLTAVQDEQVRFFDAEYRAQLRARHDAQTAVDSMWQQTYRTKFERYLNNSSQRQGDMLLVLPLGGEGRTGASRLQRTMVAVPFPARAADAREALYVFAHEVTGSLVGPIVNDNTTPAQQRSGASAAYVTLAQVWAGALLIERIAPELLDGYRAYYRAQVGAAANTTFEQAFTVPQEIRDAIRRQIDLILGGI